MASINLNGRIHELGAPDDMPLLWAIRDVLGFTGTKFGCGMGLCGSCTMHMNGSPIRSCLTPISAAHGKKIITIEGIGEDSVGKHVQDAWVKKGVPQCGYCQPGQVMSATALLKSNSDPNDQEIENAMVGNICRCGTYNRIKKAIHNASDKIKEGSK
ncbi:MAG: (2Fe-2S)-binding protein [Opitutaceae bacterium]|nr:(2Fe-2S)-binding protein [Opitutaceae bacterium]|tara:strand:+ start:291 stop:761 length:471 start_codon:yes stop_codon:yes gene_type:complete